MNRKHTLMGTWEQPWTEETIQRSFCMQTRLDWGLGDDQSWHCWTSKNDVCIVIAYHCQDSPSKSEAQRKALTRAIRCPWRRFVGCVDSADRSAKWWEVCRRKSREVESAGRTPYCCCGSRTCQCRFLHLRDRANATQTCPLANCREVHCTLSSHNSYARRQRNVYIYVKMSTKVQSFVGTLQRPWTWLMARQEFAEGCTRWWVLEKPKQ